MCYVVAEGRAHKGVKIERVVYPSYNTKRNCREELVLEYPSGHLIALSQHLLHDGITALGVNRVTGKRGCTPLSSCPTISRVH